MRRYDPLLTVSYKAVDRMIADIEHIPTGYGWWYKLPLHGRYTHRHIRKRWACLVKETLFPEALFTALLVACLTPEGTPDQRGSRLFTFLLRYYYHNDVKQLYRDWLQVKEGSV